MTRETKVGLLIGLGVILLIGIIVSDHLAVVEEQSNEQMLTFSVEAQESIRPADNTTLRAPHPPAPSFDLATMPTPPQRQPILTPTEVETRAAAPVDPIAPSEAVAGFPELPRAMRTEQPLAAQQNPLLDAVRDRMQDIDRVTGAEPPPGAVVSTRPATAFVPSVVVAPPATAVVIPPAAETVPPRANQIIHYVRPGENLTQIAKRYLGDGNLWREIARANPQSVDRKGRVFAEARLLIPSLADLGRSGAIHATASASPETPADTIVVKTGDTLSGLAAKHMGSAGQWRELLQANRDVLSRPEEMQAGMKLRLPAAGGQRQTGPAAIQAPSRPAAQPDAGQTYAVRSGDTLYSIARKTLGNGDRWKDVFDANRDRLDSADDLAIGQTLRIPG